MIASTVKLCGLMEELLLLVPVLSRRTGETLGRKVKEDDV